MIRSTYRLLAMAAISATAFSVHAQSPVLIQGPKVAIDAQDVQADSLRMPAEMRATVMSRPQTVTQIASNLYARRVMALRAETAGVEKDPEVAAALKIARDKVLSDAYIAKIDKESTPTDAAVEGFARDIYKAKPERFKAGEQVHVKHILIAGSDAASRLQIEKIQQELKAGADFDKLAKERSADKGSAEKGGDLGSFERGRMVADFDEAAFALTKPGQLSDIVETQFGFHIIKLEDRTPSRTRPFSEVRDELMNEVRNNVRQEARVAEAQKMQQEAKIDAAAIASFSQGYAAQVPPTKIAP
ncbi:peptidylprolyl isomerase [Acidovorax sp. SUPP3434]|uniref:peptidylprolyl isomerase n=1 Tax=Acidovorax sp. SUPP3434 TaxID=2920880 RepID=UPI0023DE258A|nr:peptidylprolyl isomerase [Acidovorax sp. SUPP3434]GKS98655.1 peptidylprolyl isomerase [Acidovorax sp. SUPP3434]